MRLYQRLLDADEKEMLAKYNGEMEQTEEDAIERVSAFLNTIGAFKNMHTG